MAAQKEHFEYLEVGNVEGHIVLDRGVATIDALLGKGHHVPGVTARLLMPVDDDRDESSDPFVTNMAKALDGAFHTLLFSATAKPAVGKLRIRKKAAFYQNKFLATKVYLWSKDGETSPLPAISLADSLANWQRNPSQGNVMIDFLSNDEDNLRSTQRAWSDLYGDIIESPVSKSGGVKQQAVPNYRIITRAANRERKLLRDAAARGETKAQVVQSKTVDLAAAAAAKRMAMAKDWPTASQVSRALGSTAENESQLATRFRREGKLLGVYLPTPTASWRFPTWQFAEDGEILPKFAEILSVVRDKGKFFDDQRRTTGWGEVAWFNARRHSLDGATAAELLASDPDKVLSVAKACFEEQD